MDPVTVSTLLLSFKVAALAGIACCLDDIAILAGTILGIGPRIKDDFERKDRLENAALRNLLNSMTTNRFLIGTGLASAFGIAVCTAPAAMPIIAGTLAAGAGLFFAHECVEEEAEMLEHLTDRIKAHPAFSRAMSKLTGKKASLCLPSDHGTECLGNNEIPMHASDEDILRHVSRSAAKKDRGLTVELLLLGTSAAFAQPAFMSLLTATGGNISAAVSFMTVPIFAAATATLAVIGSSSYLLTKTEKISRWFSEKHGLKKTGHGVRVAGHALETVLGPVGIILLTAIAGNMFMQGVGTLFPAFAQALPQLGSSWFAHLAYGLAAGSTTLLSVKSAAHLKSLVLPAKAEEAAPAAAPTLAVDLRPRMEPEPLTLNATPQNRAKAAWTALKTETSRRAAPIRRKTAALRSRNKQTLSGTETPRRPEAAKTQRLDELKK